MTAVAVKEEARLAWLALALTPGMGPTRIARSMQRFPDAARLFEASLTELEASGMPAAAAQFVADGRARSEAIRELEQIHTLDAAFVCPEDDAYPVPLLQIYDPPPVLWVRGNPAALSQSGIAVVGTRHPSPYGAGMAQSLSRDLAARGMAIFSGMARGVDTAAHRGAIEAGSKTVAVWGTGIDVVYPKENRKLAEEIVGTGGAIVSEFRIGTFPAPQNFPIRNRTLSGMSVGVLVVEAAEYSGTRITARCALEQGRDVYAVPGNVTNKNSWGPNTLIKQGAKLTATWEDIWEDLPSQVRIALEDERAESKPGEALSLFSDAAAQAIGEHERMLLAELTADEPVQLDALMERMDGRMMSGEIFTALFELELAGRVRQLPGKNYLRAIR